MAPQLTLLEKHLPITSELTRSWLIRLFLLILILGAGYSAWLGDAIRFLPDERDYLLLSQNLSNGNGYTFDGIHPTAFRPPGYPLLLAPLVWIGAGIPSLRMLNFLALVGAFFIFAALLTQIRDPSELRNPEKNGTKSVSLSIWSVVLLGLSYPVLFFTAGALYPQTVASFLFACLLYFVTRADHWFPANTYHPFTIMGMLWIGLLAGFLVLTVPTFLVIILLIFSWQIFHGRFQRKIMVSYALSTLVMFVILGLWTTRNAIVFHDFILVSTNIGDNLIRGNAPGATSNSGPGTDVEMYMNQVENLSEVERDRVLQNIVYETWKSNPIQAVQLYFAKVLNYFNFRNDLVTQTESSIVRDVLMFITYYGILLLAVGRLVASRTWPMHHIEKMAAVIYVFNAFYSAIVFTRIRYRLPFDYLLIFLGAHLLILLMRRGNLWWNRWLTTRRLI